ncbi:MAG: Glu-tRNA(Gln) amidotransferase subunit GatE [Candidatus Marsarchaeota archaeon]|jgi:glutamyl-tRNA(Gln) amidotransferase subunit E|nr:Glu-tRNA(Gln) amidotransferase subunit GatE [Candidatus Marsarchaeota archaeon]
MDDKAIDYYKGIGFMCGLEIHQRLDTASKLFCGCSTNPENDVEYAHVDRQQRAVAGELGAIDPSARFEESRQRVFRYKVYRNSSCLVDIDEEPPHEINQDALSIALSIARAFGMPIFDELQPMRKEVVDGSDPSAFQRTVLIGRGGKIAIDGVPVDITDMSLEEESSGIINTENNVITYDTSRLGIPLVEIDTGPDIPTPEFAKKAALYIGTVLRLSGRVKRGIGTIRQDVNVSIKGGARVEIKGLQDLDFMDKYIENEVLRQQNLLKIVDVLKARNASVMEIADLSQLFASTSVGIIKRGMENGGATMGFGLKGFKGALGTEVLPGRRLGTEISDYAKMAGVGGIIHSDEDLNKYEFSAAELEGVRKVLNISETDSFILIAAEKARCQKAIGIARDRALQAISGVPLETRAAVNDQTYTTKFLRPLPGGSRMYPETDIKPIKITPNALASAEKSAPRLDQEVSALSKDLKDAQLANTLILSGKLPLYKAIAAGTSVDRRFIASVLLQKMTELRRKGYAVDLIRDEDIIAVFQRYDGGTVTKQAIEEVIKALSEGHTDIDKIIADGSLRRISGKALKDLVSSFSKTVQSSSKDDLRNRIMAKYRLVIDGEELNRII